MSKRRGSKSEKMTFEDWCLLYLLTFGEVPSEKPEGEVEFIERMQESIGSKERHNVLLIRIDQWIHTQRKSK